MRRHKRHLDWNPVRPFRTQLHDKKSAGGMGRPTDPNGDNREPRGRSYQNLDLPAGTLYLIDACCHWAKDGGTVPLPIGAEAHWHLQPYVSRTTHSDQGSQEG